MPVDNPRLYLCDDCAQPRTVAEVYWYGRREDDSGRCEKCERDWSDRMGAWMRGEIVEPELDTRFSAKGPRGS
jgi:hypothetical protein